MMRDKRGRISIALPSHASFRLFDDHATHGINWLKKVDFIVEEASRFIFIELKDYENPNTSDVRKLADTQRFFKGAVDQSLCEKFADTYFYEIAAGRADKPVDYYVLAEISSNQHRLMQRTDNLRRLLPVDGPNPKSGPQVWKRPFVRSILILNVQKWNVHLPDYPASLI